MEAQLGHNPAALSFSEHFVIKRCKTRDEVEVLQRFPRAFVDVHLVHDTEIVMPRLVPPLVTTQRYIALLHGGLNLRDNLWNVPQPETWSAHWKDALLEHLAVIGVLTAELREVVSRLTVDWFPVHIHGDATLANLLWDPRRHEWVWCDPLVRDFIPGDPHVDLGKMFQSLWGYEEVLLGLRTELEFDEMSARSLASAFGLDFSNALDWCVVHFARLLRYQHEPFRQIFEHGYSRMLEKVTC